MGTMMPMATPNGSTRSAPRSGTKRAASTAPSAMPSATTPCSTAALFSGICSFVLAHSSTMNCSVAPAPQKRVVTASEIWPSRSFQRTTQQWANSPTSLNGLRSWCG